MLLILAWLVPRIEITPKAIFEALYESGKNGMLVGVSCAAIGILYFLFKQAGLGEITTNAINALFEHKAFSIIYLDILVTLFILVVAASIPVFLGMGLPTLAVYLIAIVIIQPILEPITNTESLHIYMFVFYYAVLAGVTPPYAPLLKSAAQLVNKLAKEKKITDNANLNQKALLFSTFRLSFIGFLLPIAWVYHPEIMIQNWSLSNLSQVVYVLLSFIIAIVAIAVAQYGVFRREAGVLSTTQRVLLGIAAFLILFPNADWLLLGLTISGVLIALGVLIYDDWQAGEDSLLRPSVVMLQLILDPKNISATTVIIFISLTIVYTGFFSTSSLAHHLQDTLIAKWLTDRPHFTLAVGDCAFEKVAKTQQWLVEQGYENSIACSPHAELTVSKMTPGEVKIEQIYAYEYQENYFSDLLTLKQSDTSEKTTLAQIFEKGVEQKQCLLPLQDKLLAQQFNPTRITSLQCSEDAGLPKPPQALPVVYIPYTLAYKLDVYEGSIISVHQALYPSSLEKDITGASQHYFVVALIYELTERFPDIENIVLFPQNTLARLRSDETEEDNELIVDYQLIVKLHNLENHQQIEHAVQLFDTPKAFPVEDEYLNSVSKELGFAVEKNNAITDNLLGTQRGLLNGMQAIALIGGFICLLVLVGGISQIVENNRKTIALMRIAGLQPGVSTTFLLLLAIIGTVIPAFVGAGLSLLVNGALAGIFEGLEPEPTWFLAIDIAGITLLMTIITTIYLTWLHFSHTIPEELRLCQQ